MTQILDFYNIIVNLIIGDPTLFVAAVYIIATIVLIISRAPNIVFLYALTAVTGILAIEFPALRWGLAIFGLGFVGFMYMRIRRE